MATTADETAVATIAPIANDAKLVGWLYADLWRNSSIFPDSVASMIAWGPTASIAPAVVPATILPTPRAL